MVMKMLAAGGVEILTDQIRKADIDNPKGYYEFELVKKLETDTSWLPQARGRAVKIISMLLKHLPPGHDYKIIFVSRNIQEVLASQKQMLIRRGEPTDRISDKELAGIYETHLNQLAKWLNNQSGFDVLMIHYNDILKDPDIHSERINSFIGGYANVKHMADVVDKSLYRQRR
jgi:hypothetical protein